MNPKQPQTPRHTVLVVDDETAVRSALSRELSGTYKVVPAPGLEEAMEILARRLDFAAVVTDMVMREPGDGYVLLEAARLLMPHCVRVLVSATSHGGWYVETGAAHAFVEKPWKPGEILAVVGRLVS